MELIGIDLVGMFNDPYQAEYEGLELIECPIEEWEYLGADDKAGPNYTGQEAVNSYYRFRS